MSEVCVEEALAEPSGSRARTPARRLATPLRRSLVPMSGLSIAAPCAAGWITDFLNAAYYRRVPEARSVDDLRLAFAVLTTWWHRSDHRRLGAYDVLSFHRAFGIERFLGVAGSGQGTLNRRQLLEGASHLLGPWFSGAYADDSRRGWGIVFETVVERESYRPEERLRKAAVSALTPPVAAEREQTWLAHPPVPVYSASGVAAALRRTEGWPDYASALGRFTPLRSGGLAGQTFEIEVVAHPITRIPVFTRGYVTVTRLASRRSPGDLDAYVAELNALLARSGGAEPQAVPAGATPWLAFDLTTHAGHFMGRGRNSLLLFEEGGRPYLRVVSVWDPMEHAVRWAYRSAGMRAQHAFWGPDSPEESMLHQVAAAAP